METKKPASEYNLLDPVPYGNTRFEVQRDLGRGKAERVAVFDSLEAAREYVQRFNAYPKLVEALHDAMHLLRVNGLANHNDQVSRAEHLLRSLGEDQ